MFVMSCNQPGLSLDAPQSAQPMPPGLFPVRVDGKFGYIDRAGELVIHPQFDLASAFQEDRASVMIRSEDDQQLYAVIDSKGETIVAPQINQIARFSEGRAVFQDAHTGKRGYVDPQGVVVIPAMFDTASAFRNGVAHVLMIMIDEDEALQRAAKVLSRIPASKVDALGWNDIGIPVEHYYIDRSGARLGDIDVDDEEPALWIAVHDTSEPLVRRREQKFGFVSKDGEFVIEAQYEAATEFSEGLAAVRIDQRWGYIGRDGTMVILPQWTFAWPFQGGLAQVEVEDGRTGYIDATGAYVWPPSK